MGTCRLCGRRSKEISSFIGLCRECIVERPDEALKIAEQKHKELRGLFSLQYPIPSEGIKCDLCGNECRIPDGGVGFCGLTKNEGGRLVRPEDLIAEIYYDPHPTNCVPMEFCGASGAGYPEYSYTRGREYGYYNLSVFCIGCSSSCPFCQNWHFLEMLREKERYRISKEKFISYIHDKVSCVCFFGGDPTVQMDKIIDYCEEARERLDDRILRFCLETNGNFNKGLLKRFATISLASGGGIKFDLKFYDPNLSKVITGMDNERSYECFEMLGDLHRERSRPPFLRASTLLLPGYVTPDEVEEIAKFISSISPDIPYSLLAFHPDFMMRDMPHTLRKTALECKKRAERHLKRVRIGNPWLLV